MSTTKASNKNTNKITDESLQVENNIDGSSIKVDLNLDLSEYVDYDFNTSDIASQREIYVKLVNEINSLIARVKTLDNVRCSFLEKMQIHSNEDILTGIQDDFDSDQSDEISDGEVVETKLKKPVEKSKKSKKLVTTTESESDAIVAEKSKKGKKKVSDSQELIDEPVNDPVNEPVVKPVSEVKQKKISKKKPTDSVIEQSSSELDQLEKLPKTTKKIIEDQVVQVDEVKPKRTTKKKVVEELEPESQDQVVQVVQVVQVDEVKQKKTTKKKAVEELEPESEDQLEQLEEVKQKKTTKKKVIKDLEQEQEQEQEQDLEQKTIVQSESEVKPKKTTRKKVVQESVEQLIVQDVVEEKKKKRDIKRA